MKFIKDNAYIFVGSLLVLAFLTIIINSIYAGYQQYKLKGEPHMYGLMYISPEGVKEYYSNTDMGTTTTDVNGIAVLAQKKTAEAKAKQLLKAGHLENAGGEIYVVQVMKVVLSPELVTIPKKKSGYIIETQDAPGLKPCYFKGPLKREYYSSYEYSDCLTPATVFSTEKKALAAIELFTTALRDSEAEDLLNHKRHHPLRMYSKDFPTVVERNNFVIEHFKVVKFEEDN